MPALLAGPTLEMLLNQKPDRLTDLKIYRTRMSEIILRILYKQLSRAANSYAHRVEFGDQDARLMLVPKYSGTINEVKITSRQKNGGRKNDYINEIV